MSGRGYLMPDALIVPAVIWPTESMGQKGPVQYQCKGSSA